MKSIGLLTVFIAFSSLAGAQMNVQMHMSQKLGDQKFYFNTPVLVEEGYYISVSRLQYYLSGIELVHDGGQITPVNETYFLIGPARDSILDLGIFDNIVDLEEIHFSIGVDSAHNHLDPTQWPAEHPLAPKNPSMHWGWQGGYRFIAFEGLSGAIPDPMVDNYQIHGLDDSNYKQVVLPADEVVEEDVMRVLISADYTQLVDSINVLGGMIEHGSLGVPGRLIRNLATKVFTTQPVTSIGELNAVIPLTISPNPTQGEIAIEGDIFKGQDLQVIVVDMNGKEKMVHDLANQDGKISLQVNLPAGTYLLYLRNQERIMASGQLIIQH